MIAVCDKCKVKCDFKLIQFLQKHIDCNFTGCRVIPSNFLPPNRARDYELIKQI